MFFIKNPKLKVFVKADHKLLKQVVLNLLDNAIKYNKRGGSISLNIEIVKNGCVRFSVIDTGYGLSEKDLKYLFIPFSRLGAESKGIDGSGIGLSLCKEIIELMQGKIGVRSHVGEGSCFWIELPHIDIVNGKDTETVSASDDLYLKKGTAEKILLVEDNLVNSEVAVDMLATMGVSVDVANNGEQALELFDINEYSLILMDCEMPVMDGFTATKLLRQKEHDLAKSSIPIIALTAHAITGTREKCLACGMNDFLSKPFSMLDLYLLLSEWLQMDSASLPNKADNLIFTEKNNFNFNCNAEFLECELLSDLYATQIKNKSNILIDVVNAYLEQSTQLLDELVKAHKKSDVESIRKITHTLKSSSINVGAVKFSGLCRIVELACECGKINNVILQSVYDTYPDIKNALDDVLHAVT